MYTKDQGSQLSWVFMPNWKYLLITRQHDKIHQLC